MRVVAGTARGRRLVAPPGTDVRPTTDRVREAIFNALGSLGAVHGAVVADLFAGSGALGIEALSRGADRAWFAEPDRRTRGVVERNLDTTGLGDRATVVPATAEVFLAAALRRGQHFDLVLCDPPYAYDGWPALLAAVGPVTGPESMVVVESDRAVEVPEGWQVARDKAYGGTVVRILVPPAAPDRLGARP